MTRTMRAMYRRGFDDAYYERGIRLSGIEGGVIAYHVGYRRGRSARQKAR